MEFLGKALCLLLFPVVVYLQMSAFASFAADTFHDKINPLGRARGGCGKRERSTEVGKHRAEKDCCDKEQQGARRSIVFRRSCPGRRKVIRRRANNENNNG